MGGIPWTKEEDQLLRICIEKYGEGKWHRIPLLAGLGRCRKSCRLRWLNYLRPNIKRGDFDEDEVDLIIKLQRLLGNRWSLVAARLPGRTGNDVKNYWNCHLRKKLGAQETHEDNKKHCASSSNNIVQVMRPQPSTNINIIGQPSLMLGQEQGSSSSVPMPMPVPVSLPRNTNENNNGGPINYQKLQMDHMNIGGVDEEQTTREMGDFGTDLRFEEQVKKYEDEDDQVNHKWIWDDSILDTLWPPYS